MKNISVSDITYILCDFAEIHFINLKKKKQSRNFFKSKKLFFGCVLTGVLFEEMISIKSYKKCSFTGQANTEESSRLHLNGSRQLSRSATELRENQSDTPNRSPEHLTRDNAAETDTRYRHHRHVSVAQRTHTFFATLKSRWARGRSKERKKSKDGSSSHGQDSYRNPGLESDYAADYSSEHSRSSSATQSPAKNYLNHPGN